MAPFKRCRGDSSEGESDGASGSDSSDSGQSGNSGSVQEVVPTPGRIYEESDSEGVQASSKSASNSPASHKSDSPAPSRRSHSRSQSHEKSESPVSARSRSSSYEKSTSPKSNKSKQSSPKSVYSRSPASSVRSARSQSPKGSVRSQKSVSPTNSHASRSLEGSHSPRSSKGSGSVRQSPQSASARSRSRSRSRSASSNRSERSNRSNRSNRSANRYESAKSAGSNSPGSQASRSRSPSPVVNGVKAQSDAGSDEDVSDSRKRLRSVSDESQASNKEDNEGSNDEDEIEGRRKKPAKIDDSGSSSSGDEKSKDPATAEALFGDADDITSEEEEARSKKSEGSDVEEVEETVGRKSDEEEDKKSEGEKEKDEAEKEEVIPETRIDVEIPRIVCDIGRDLHFVKLPNFLSVDTRPFTAETYEDEIDEEETLDEEGRARLKLKVENTIRWREAFDKDGNPTKESNARMVRWSDGSMSLHLGSEIFDVYKQLLQGDHNHLFIRQGTGLQGQAVFRTKLTFRPHSTESFTHRKMTLSLADRSQKSTGIKVLSQVGHDPDQHRGEMIKKEEERLRATLRRENKAKRTRERGAGRPLNTPYLEPDREDGSDDEGAISLNAIKNKYQAKNDRKQNIYSSDDEGSDLEARRPRRSDKVRALQDSDEDDEGRSERNSEASDES